MSAAADPADREGLANLRKCQRCPDTELSEMSWVITVKRGLARFPFAHTLPTHQKVLAGSSGRSPGWQCVLASYLSGL